MASTPNGYQQKNRAREVRNIADSAARGLDSCALDLFAMRKNGETFEALTGLLDGTNQKREIAIICEAAKSALSRKHLKYTQGRLTEEEYQYEVEEPAKFFGIPMDVIARTALPQAETAPIIVEAIEASPPKAPGRAPKERSYPLHGLDSLESLVRKGELALSPDGENPAARYFDSLKQLKTATKRFDAERNAGAPMDELLSLYSQIDGALKTLNGLNLEGNERETTSRSTTNLRHTALRAEIQEQALTDLENKTDSLSTYTRPGMIYKLGTQLAYTAELFGQEDERFQTARDKITGNTAIMKSLLSQIDAHCRMPDAEARYVADAMANALYPEEVRGEQGLAMLLATKQTELESAPAQRYRH